MLDYGNKLVPEHDPLPWWKRAALALVWPLLWLGVGVAIVTLVLLFWFMPISTSVNPFEWASMMLGLSSASPQYGIGSGIAQMAMTLPCTLLVLLLLSISSTMAIYRRRVAVAVLGHVASAVHLRIPLPHYLRAAAAGERAALARRLNRLADQLAGGRPIADALADTAGELPPLMIDRIRAAERSFTLDSALGPIMEREKERAEASRRHNGSRPYNLLLLAVMLAVMTLVLVFVVPKYAQIFADFKVKLPYATQLFIDVGRVMFGPGLFGMTSVAFLVIALPVLGLGMLAILARAARGLFTSRQGRRWSAPVVDPVVWYTPFFGRLVRDRNAAVMCDALAEALIVGRPMPDAILLAALPSLNRVLRKRMAAWLDGVEQGQPTALAARNAHMPELLCDMLAGASGEPATAVAFAGRAYAASAKRRLVLVDAVVPITFTFILAAMVAFIAVALITPLATLASSISVGGLKR